MKALITLVLLSSLLLLPAAHAEGGCPPGQYPQQGQGWQTCVPIPGGSAQQQGQSLQPTERWQDRWGALATNSQGQITGASEEQLSESDAITVAISDCKAFGEQGCKKFGTYKNQCVAVVPGNLKSESATASSEQAAIMLATNACTSGGQSGCRVYYSACSLPRRCTKVAKRCVRAENGMSDQCRNFRQDDMGLEVHCPTPFSKA